MRKRRRKDISNTEYCFGRDFFLSYRSDIKTIDFIEYRRRENFWKNNQKFQLEKEEFDKLIGFFPSVLSYVETFENCFYLY